MDHPSKVVEQATSGAIRLFTIISGIVKKERWHADMPLLMNRMDGCGGQAPIKGDLASIGVLKNGMRLGKDAIRKLISMYPHSP